MAAKKKSDIIELSPLEKKILKDLRKADLTDAERKRLLKQIQTPEIERGRKVRRHYPSRHFRVGVTSDWHVGNKNFRYDVFEDSVKIFNKEKVDEIYHPGDIIEGMSNRDGHIYELAIPGVSGQLDRAVDLLNQYKQPITGVLGNHDLWAMKKGNQGMDIAGELERRVKNLSMIGHLYGDIQVNPNTTIRLSHEGASSYALSYSMQKRINSLSGGDKPSVIFNGHLHKALYMFYRNIHAVEAGTLEDQTEFMKMKGSPSHVGFWICDIHYNRNGVTKFSPTFYPYFKDNK